MISYIIHKSFNPSLKSNLNKTNDSTIVLIQCGEMELGFKNERVQIQKRNLVYIPIGSIHYFKIRKESKSSAIILQFSYVENKKDNKSTVFLNQNDFTLLKLNRLDFIYLKQLFKLLHFNLNYRTNSIYLQTINKHLLNSVLTDLEWLIFKQQIEILEIEKPINPIVVKFLLLLDQECRSNHNIEFFASKLCITRDYLSKIIKIHTGKSPKALLNQILLFHAKTQLGNRKLSILDISESLGFSNLDTFIRFFKKNQKITPSKYRKFLDKELWYLDENQY